MRAYEMMVIVDVDVDEAGVTKVIDRVKDLVGRDGGTVATVDLWGLRKFAYTINHKTEGTYVVFEIQTAAGGLNEVDRSLRLADEVVRHKIIRLPDQEAARRGLLASAG